MLPRPAGASTPAGGERTQAAHGLVLAVVVTAVRTHETACGQLPLDDGAAGSFQRDKRPGRRRLLEQRLSPRRPDGRRCRCGVEATDEEVRAAAEAVMDQCGWLMQHCRLVRDYRASPRSRAVVHCDGSSNAPQGLPPERPTLHGLGLAEAALSGALSGEAGHAKRTGQMAGRRR